MTAGRNIEINHDVDWIQDEDDNVIGYQRDPKTQVAIATWTDGTYSALRTPAGRSVAVGGGAVTGQSFAVSKHWTSELYMYAGAGNVIYNTPATWYGKQKCSGNPRRVRAVIINHMYKSGKAYTQTGTSLVITLAVGSPDYHDEVGISVGDKVYMYPATGLAPAGWYPVSAVSSTTLTLTMDGSLSTSGTCSYSRPVLGYKMAVALTELSSNSTIQSLYTPVVNGVEYNVTSSVSQYGFSKIDFNKSIFKNATYLGRAEAPKIVSAFFSSPVFGVSDWVGLPEVLSDDGKGANFLFRVYHEDAVSGPKSEISAIELQTIANPQFIAAAELSGKPYYRPYFQTHTPSVDGVETLTAFPATTTPSQGILVAFEFDYGVDTVSVATFGDSTQAASQFDYGISNYATFTCNVSGSQITLTSNVGTGIPIPIVASQEIGFSGRINNADGSGLFVTGLASGTPGTTGAVYNLSASQTTATGVSANIGQSKAKLWQGWPSKAVLGKSTVAKPYELFNCALSGSFSAYFFPEFLHMLAAGIVPSVVHFQGYSYNDGGAPTSALLNKYKAKLLSAVEAGRSAGIKCILVSTWPASGDSIAFPTSLADVLAHNDWIRNLAATGITDGAPDFDGVRQSMTTDLFYSPDGSATYASFGDKIHPGIAGEDAMAALFATFI